MPRDYRDPDSRHIKIFLNEWNSPLVSYHKNSLDNYKIFMFIMSKNCRFASKWPKLITCSILDKITLQTVVKFRNRISLDVLFNARLQEEHIMKANVLV